MSAIPLRRPVFSILTDITCGENCWHAKEDICRCECGGKNHGVLLTAGGEQPVRSARIDGVRYELRAVGKRGVVMVTADEINGQQYRSLETATLYDNGEQSWWSQYHYHWSETDSGAPARVKYATPLQREKWAELQHCREDANTCLLWVRAEMPDAPTIKRIAKDGTVAPYQSPNEEKAWKQKEGK